VTWIYNVGYKRKPDKTINIIFLSIGYFIILISCLIYNEVIILNFCNLNQNTNYFINERNTLDKKLADNFSTKELEDIGDYYIRHQNSKSSLSSENSSSVNNSKTSQSIGLLPK
jgi:hypothetical protein